MLPKVVTFDGEARSGKGTIAQATKDFLRDVHGYKVMLIDAGQVFRVLVVAATRAGVDLNNPDEIDEFLSNNDNAQKCVQLVKDVYQMPKKDRDVLLYTNEVGANSAKVGARPLSQHFKDELLKKWLHDAHDEGYEIVLLDGRALEETGTMLEASGLCRFAMGLYFVCDAKTGARRTLGHALVPQEQLEGIAKDEVEALVQQIFARNEADKTRAVQPIVPPQNAPVFYLPDIPHTHEFEGARPMAIMDTSADMTKDAMTQPVSKFVAKHL
jgi:cytidylate kinase